MALFEDMFKSASIPGIAIAVGAAVLAPVLLPVVGRVVRPVVKTALRTGISLYREVAAQMAETAGPIVREARAEMSPREETAYRGT